MTFPQKKFSTPLKGKDFLDTHPTHVLCWHLFVCNNSEKIFLCFNTDVKNHITPFGGKNNNKTLF